MAAGGGRAGKGRRSAAGGGRGSGAPRGPFALSDDLVERRLLDASDPGPLEDYFGPGQCAELRRLAEEAGRRSLRGAPRVLILPGVMGSRLGVEIPGWFDDVVWVDPLEIAFGGVGRLALPDGGRIRALGVMLFSYLALKYRLRREGFDARFHPFDWRRSLRELGDELAQAIEDGPETTHVVAHSMGGLVARSALRRPHGKLGRLVMLGTPNHGSFAVVEAFRGAHPVVRKIDFLDPTRSAERLAREVFGGFTGLLEMIPAPERYGVDLFDPAVWPDDGPRPDAAALEAARGVRSELPADHPQLYVIAGADRETIVGARVEDGRFVYETSLEGDGSVPLSSAVIASAQATYYVAEDHGALANNRRVAEAVGSILATGATTVLPTERDRRLAAPGLVDERARRGPVFAGRPGGAGEGAPAAGALSLREQRSLIEEFAAPDRAPAPLTAIENPLGAPAPDAPISFADRVVIGRERERRIEIALALGSIAEADAPACVLGLFRHVTPGGPARALDRRLGGAIAQMVERRMFNANLGEISIVPTGRHPLRADMVAFVGLGPYDAFDERALAVVGENLVRTFASTRVDEFAMVPFGGGSGRFTPAALARLLKGLFQGLRDADSGRRFRGVTICETDRDRYLAIRDEIHRLSATALFDGIEATLREIELPAAPEPEAARGSDLPRERPLYLLVRQEPVTETGQVEFSASLLTSGAQAAIRKDRVAFREAELHELLAELHTLDAQDDLAAFGERLAALVLPESTRETLAAYADDPLTIVHDADAAIVPWETLRLDHGFPAVRGGLSHRYEAENLSVAKWLDRRRMGPVIDLLLVVDPTEDLPGAGAGGRAREGDPGTSQPPGDDPRAARRAGPQDGAARLPGLRRLRRAALCGARLLRPARPGAQRPGVPWRRDRRRLRRRGAGQPAEPRLLQRVRGRPHPLRARGPGRAGALSGPVDARADGARFGLRRGVPARRRRQFRRHLLAGRRRRRGRLRPGLLRAAGRQGDAARGAPEGARGGLGHGLDRLGGLHPLWRSGLRAEAGRGGAGGVRRRPRRAAGQARPRRPVLGPLRGAGGRAGAGGPRRHQRRGGRRPRPALAAERRQARLHARAGRPALPDRAGTAPDPYRRPAAGPHRGPGVRPRAAFVALAAALLVGACASQHPTPPLTGEAGPPPAAEADGPGAISCSSPPSPAAGRARRRPRRARSTGWSGPGCPAAGPCSTRSTCSPPPRAAA